MRGLKKSSLAKLQRSLYAFFGVIILVSCSEPENPIASLRKELTVTFEKEEPSEAYPEGLIRMQLEDVSLEVPIGVYESNSPVVTGLNIRFCFSSDPLYDTEDCQDEKSYGAIILFRAAETVSQSTRDPEDFSKLPNHSDDTYILQPSTEYPDIDEYYLFAQEKAFQFLIDYVDTETNREIRERIGCSPGFRARELRSISNLSDECSFSTVLGEHVYVSIRFDSELLNNLIAFEKKSYEIINKIIVDNEN